MHFHVENYPDESIYALLQNDDVLRGNALRNYVKTLAPIKDGITRHPFDFSYFFEHLDHEGIRCYGDGQQLFLVMRGNNSHYCVTDYFDGVVHEALQLMDEKMPCSYFKVMEITETKLFALNQYNVMVALRGDCNRLLLFSLTEALAKRVMRDMINDPTDLTEDASLMRAAVCELGNMIVGSSLKHLLPIKGLHMSIPMYFESAQGQILETSNAIKMSICSSCGESFKVYGINF